MAAPHRSRHRSRTVLAALLLATARCASTTERGRSAAAWGASLADDAMLRDAERALADGDLVRARALWAALRDARPSGAVHDVALLRLARIDLIGDGEPALADAVSSLARLPRDLEPSLALRRELLEGLIAARRGSASDAVVARLRAGRGRFIDAPDAVEANCAVAALAVAPAAALEALARVEAATERGVRWLPTRLPCDLPAERSARFEGIVPRVDEPSDLAAALDVLPAEHAWRVGLARRLRAVAEARGEARRWASHLADLPDDEAAIRPAVAGTRDPLLRIGILAPLSGPASNVGAEVVRGAQQAVESVARVELVVGDETPQREAVDRASALRAVLADLHRRAVDVVVGPALDEDVAPALEAARAEGMVLRMPTPPSGTSAAANAAGPSLDERCEALAAAARTRGVRVQLHLPPEPGPTLDGALRAALGRHGVGVARAGEAAAAEVVAGFFGAEDLRRIAAAARAAPERWIFDARGATPGTPGEWVGLGPTAAYASFRTAGCGRSDRAPSELAALFHDAVLATLRSAGRTVSVEPVLDRSALLIGTAVAAAEDCAPGSSVR